MKWLDDSEEGAEEADDEAEEDDLMTNIPAPADDAEDPSAADIDALTA